MGVVSEYLRDLIATQVQEQSLVVWFDPEGRYQAFAAGLELPNTRVARYEGSFFALRHAIGPLLAGERPPQLVVYIDGLAEAEAYGALAELTAPGAVMA